MDLLSPSLFFHLTILINIYLLLFFICRKLFNPTNLPPGKTGFPFIGETMDFIKANKNAEPWRFITDRTTKYSSHVFKTSLFRQNVIVFCGDAGNKFMLSTAKKNLAFWLPPSISEAFGVADILSGPVANNFRTLVVPEFVKIQALQRYIPIMDYMAKQHVESEWLSRKEGKALVLIKQHILALSCRLFLNVKDPKEFMGSDMSFTELLEGLLSMPVNFPGMPYRRALKASKLMHERLLSIIKKRKFKILSEHEECKNPDDILTKMLLMKDENGEDVFSEKIVANAIAALLFGSHDSLSSSTVFIVKHLAENPHVYTKVQKEQMEIANSKGPGELLNWNDIQNMKYSWCVARESMRLATPSQGGYRVASIDVKYEGFTIPKGWKAHWTPHSTMRNPKYFEDPEKFEPSRFEGKGPIPHSYLPFGGGPHICPGREIGRLGMLTFMHNLVTKLKCQTMIPDEKRKYGMTVTPADGLPIRIYPLN